MTTSPYSRVSLIGAPTDIGAGARGASMGPEALRVANIAAVLASHGLDVADRGGFIRLTMPAMNYCRKLGITGQLLICASGCSSQTGSQSSPQRHQLCGSECQAQG